MKQWAEGDKEAQYQNMNAMWRDPASPENILVMNYEYPILSHGLDAYSSPWIYRMPLSAGTCPTEDFMELFDGFDRYPNGTIRVTDGTDHSNGNYILYEEPLDFFANVEPRLRAYVIFPGDFFKKDVIEIRAGIYTGNLPIKVLKADYSYAQRGRGHWDQDCFKGSTKTLFMSPNVNTEKVTYKNATTGENVTTYASGANGPSIRMRSLRLRAFIYASTLIPTGRFEDIGKGRVISHSFL